MKKMMITISGLLLGLAGYAQQSGSNLALDSLNSIKDPILLNTKLKMLGSGSEADMILLMNYYGRSAKPSDSLAQLAMKKFPKGRIAMGIKFNEVNSEKNPIVQEQLLDQLKKDFPANNFEQLNLMLAYNFANAKNTPKTLEYMEVLKGKARARAMGVIPGILMTYDLNTAEKVVVREMAVQNISNEDRMTLLNVYSRILSKKGEHQKAFTVIKEYYDQDVKKTPALTAYYYLLLSKSGDYKAAFPELEKAAVEGLADEDLKQELKSSFVKLNPGKNAEVYLSSLQKKLEDKYQKEMISRMVNEASPNFKVKDVNGKEVSLADFKGKVIVLDFWATWCGPCKRSLPAMQMTVDKYKNDPKVNFLFIHTWESVPDPKADAIKYFTDNKFNLPLYLDLKEPVTQKNPAVSLFNVDGIPAKFVIDGAGHIRFKMSGFGGTNENAVAELSAMIELSRKSD